MVAGKAYSGLRESWLSNRIRVCAVRSSVVRGPRLIINRIGDGCGRRKVHGDLPMAEMVQLGWTELLIQQGRGVFARKRPGGGFVRMWTCWQIPCCICLLSLFLIQVSIIGHGSQALEFKVSASKGTWLRFAYVPYLTGTRRRAYIFAKTRIHDARALPAVPQARPISSGHRSMLRIVASFTVQVLA